jgi:hypothetical protein
LNVIGSQRIIVSRHRVEQTVRLQNPVAVTANVKAVGKNIIPRPDAQTARIVRRQLPVQIKRNIGAGIGQRDKMEIIRGSASLCQTALQLCHRDAFGPVFYRL